MACASPLVLTGAQTAGKVSLLGYPERLAPSYLVAPRHSMPLAPTVALTCPVDMNANASVVAFVTLPDFVSFDVDVVIFAESRGYERKTVARKGDVFALDGSMETVNGFEMAGIMGGGSVQLNQCRPAIDSDFVVNPNLVVIDVVRRHAKKRKLVRRASDVRSEVDRSLCPEKTTVEKHDCLCRALRSLGFPVGSAPPMRAATSTSRMSFVNNYPRFESIAPFFRLMFAHLEWPAIDQPNFRS